MPKHIAHLRAYVEKGLSFNGSTFWTTTYESNLPHSLRFMVDNKMVGMAWIELPKGEYSVRPKSFKRTVS